MYLVARCYENLLSKLKLTLSIDENVKGPLNETSNQYALK